MTALAWLIPCALALGGLGLAAFIWSLNSGQFNDLEGSGWRAIQDDADEPPPQQRPESRPPPRTIR
jgi:cbb3-type cytochrome oxidase maturation protein